ncbi:EAL and HDOD domain-containing protein [Dactylosporangium sucinum]|uniref:EAL and HDOD domain-containing protein n=1 Tax=Dactylosporangium sucinum TaxID=1424081 RepID=UPI0035EBE5EA
MTSPAAPNAPQQTQTVHVGRQPIYDRDGAVAAYELLFRGRLDAVAAGRRDTFATSQVITNTFTEFGVNEIAGDRPCFINLTREFLVGELPLPFGPERVVLEVLETVTVDEAVERGVARLRDEGYRIALDDFVFGAGHERLLGLAAYVKLDLLDTPPEQLDAIVALCRQYHGIRFVGERIESDRERALADRFGCELLQGYALSRPEVLTATGLAPSRLSRLRLLGALGAADGNLDEVLRVIADDPALALRLLKACNSAAVAPSRPVTSLRQAVVLLGLTHVRQWAMLMIVDDVAAGTVDQFTDAVTRARLCQHLAGDVGAAPETAFTAGLISSIAGLLDTTPAALAAQLPLADDLVEAITTGGGPVGRALGLADAYLSGGAVEAADPARCYLDALRWSTRVVDATASARAS